MENRIAALKARIAGLGPEERKAFRARVEAAGIDWSRVAPPDAPAERPDRIPLSPSQMQFWLLQQMNPESAAFSIAFGWDVDGPLDHAHVHAALESLMTRHEALRTGFQSEDGVPWQVIAPEAEPPLTIVAPEDAEADRAAFAAQPFDLARAPLFRVRIQELGEGRSRVLFVLHHIIADGWSRGILMREFAECYAARVAGRRPDLSPLTRHHADFVLEEQAWLASSAAESQEAFWRDTLDGIAPQELPTRASSSDRTAATALHRIDPALAARVAPAAAAMGVTPFMLLLAVFQLLLHRMTGSDDIAVGTPTAGRSTPEAEEVIGLFLNTVVLRSQVEPGLSFRGWLDRIRGGFVAAFEHRALPFARVVEAVGAERRAGQTPLFQTLFQLQTTSYGVQNADTVDLGDPRLSVRQQVIPLPEAKFDLSWHMMEQGGGLSVVAEYRAALFDADWMARLFARFETLLGNVIAHPDAPLGELEFVPPEEAAGAVLTGPVSGPECLISRIADRLAETEVALIDAETGESWSGARLDRAATALARRLRGRPEIEENARVAICLPRGPVLIVAMLAALKAGVAYVPLDPDHPKARRDGILADAGVALMLAPEGTEAPCPVLDPRTAGDAPEGELPAPDPERLTYLIFTSGSTGRPKGVPITHGALSNLIASAACMPGMDSSDRMLALTTVAFDIAALEILLPLATGATLVLAGGETARAPDRLAEVLDAHGITHMQATPATWRMLIDWGWTGRHRLTALCGGEALPSDLARALLTKTGTLWNMYGPTETTIWSAILRVSDAHLDGPRARVGGPVANTTLRVLDRYGATLPPGVPGELAIGGAGLSPGYWNRDDLTSAAFGEVAGERLYRTGDLVRLEPDGTLDFLGRLDHQIKLNGHRIEPGEIEAALKAVDGIDDALVVARRHRLVAYCRTGRMPEDAALRATLAQGLPGYMIPAVFVALDAFPLNPNGKIDRARLTEPEAAESGGRQAETEAEILLQTIWSEVLGREIASVDQNFFDLGGASVTAMQIASRARARGMTLTPVQMFEHQTIASQAAAAQIVAPVARHLPLSPWQLALAGSTLIHLRLPVGDVEPGALRKAVDGLAASHAALRILPGPHGNACDAAGVPFVAGDSDPWPALDGTASWGASIRGDALEIVAHPMLLDRASAERLAGELRDLLQGRCAAGSDDAYSDWLAGEAVTDVAQIAPLPGDGPEDTDTRPIAQTLDPARLRDMRGAAQVHNVPPAQIAAAALLGTLATWRPGETVSLALIEDMPTPGLGQFTRVLPLDTRPGGDAAARIRAVAEAVRRADPRGIDPRDVPEGAVVLDWTTLETAGVEWLHAPDRSLPATPALRVVATMSPDTLTLDWQFDPRHLRRTTVERLAARFLAELGSSGAARADSKLDRLRLRLMDGNR
ncbi:MAG: non-ribosomal peptide synthetase [Pseudooceanicola nanhaiensis]